MRLTILHDVSEVSAMPLIDRWVSSDATHNAHEAIDSPTRQIWGIRDQSKVRTSFEQHFRSEIQGTELQPDEMQEPALRGKACDWTNWLPSV